MVEQIKGQLESYLVANKVNLSKQRKDSILEKLAKKVTTEEEIETAIEDYSVFIVEIAKADDRARTLEANKQSKSVETMEQKQEEVKEPQNEALELLKQMQVEIQSLKTEKVHETLKAQFLADKEVKGVPNALLEKLAPKSADEYESAIQEANRIALEFNKTIPDTTPPISTGNPQTPTDTEIKNLTKDILG